MSNGRLCTLVGDFLRIEFPNTHIDALLPQVRKLPNRKWNDDKKFWMIRVSLPAINFVVSNNFDLSPADASRLAVLVKRQAEREKNKEIRVQYAKTTSSPIISQVAAEMKLPAWEYQWNPLNYALLSDGVFILGDDMAAGKSVESLMIVNHDRWKHKPVLVITPVPQTFQKELHKFFNGTSMVVTGPIKALSPCIRYYFCSYERLKHFFVPSKDNPKELLPRPFVKDFFIIVDEAHNLKNRKTIRNDLASKLLWNSENKVLMTGTPVVNRPSELYELLRLLDKDFMPWYAFMKQYCGLKMTDYGVKYDGASNLQTLNRYLYENCFVRREKDQIQKFLPELTRTSIDIKDKPVKIPANTMFELFSKSAEFKSKDKEFLDWIETMIDSTEKIGIFCYHKVMVEALMNLCTKKNVKFVRIDGTTAKDGRQALIDKFEADKEIKVAILSLAVAGTGLNGLQVASTCIFAELFWTPGLILQAECRFHRPGLKDALSIYFPKVTELEARMTDLILEKIAIFRRITSIEEIPDSLNDESLKQQLAREFGIQEGKKVEAA